MGSGRAHLRALTETEARLMMPGRTLHRLAALMCCAKTLERVVEPAIADLQKEYAGANRVSRRAWVLLAGYVAILKVIAICALNVSATTDDERRTLMRTFAWSACMILTSLTLLMVPPLLSNRYKGWLAATTLVPQAMGLAIPIGIVFGVAFALKVRPTMNLVKVMLVGAIAASVISFGILAWGIPAANEAFRDITFRELRAGGYDGPVTPPQKGLSEMTLSELRSQAAQFTAGGEPRIARRFVFSFHFRFAFAAASLALAAVLLAAPLSHRGWRGALAFGACFTYWVLMFAGDWGSRRGYMPALIGAWLPNIVMIALAIVVASSRSSRLRDSMTHAQ